MSIKDKIIMCFSNLYKRKVRTLLTTVGVVVGTCAIIITVSLGVGMQQAQEEALSQMGDLTIINGIPMAFHRIQIRWMMPCWKSFASWIM